MNGGEWEEPKQNYTVANHGPPFPHSFLSCETHLEQLSVNYLPKPTSEKLLQNQTSPLQNFYIACTPPHKKIHSLFHEIKSYGNLTHNIVKGDSDSAVQISFSDHNYR